MVDFRSKLLKTLRFCGSDAEAVTDRICEKCLDFTTLASVDADVLRSLSSDKYAAMIKVMTAIASRKVTEKFKFGVVHTDEEIEGFLSAYYLDFANETLLLLPIDDKGRVLAAEKMVEGTVNFSSVLPRKLLEIMLKYNSSKAIIAHNHPGGKATPSREDVETTRALSAMFLTIGKELVCHYVVAGSEAVKVDIG